MNEKHKFHTTFHPGSIKQLRWVGGIGGGLPVLVQRHYHAGGSLSGWSDLEGRRGDTGARGMRKCWGEKCPVGGSNAGDLYTPKSEGR